MKRDWIVRVSFDGERFVAKPRPGFVHPFTENRYAARGFRLQADAQKVAEEVSPTVEGCKVERRGREEGINPGPETCDKCHARRGTFCAPGCSRRADREKSAKKEAVR